jgi:hypothetical protein
VPALQPVDQWHEDRRQDGREDQRDQQVADEPEQKERDRHKDRDPHQQPCATPERLEPVRQAQRPFDGWRRSTIHAPVLRLASTLSTDQSSTPPRRRRLTRSG